MKKYYLKPLYSIARCTWNGNKQYARNGNKKDVDATRILYYIKRLKIHKLSRFSHKGTKAQRKILDLCLKLSVFVARVQMSLESDLREVLEELKRYFEFQKILGLEVLVMARGKRKKDPTQPETLQEKNVLNVQEQLGIFDFSSKKLTLEEIRAEIDNCCTSKLHQWRKNIVFGEGNSKARLMFIGEAPGENEDKQGRPFVGRAGQLLTKVINAMGLERSDVYITNIVKCRPPENRTPEPDEIIACAPFLFKQIRAIDPEVIVCLGNVAAQTVLRTKEKLGNLRGKFHSYGRAKVMATYHPAALLRNPGFKKPLWDDMQLVMKELGISGSGVTPSPIQSGESGIKGKG